MQNYLHQAGMAIRAGIVKNGFLFVIITSFIPGIFLSMPALGQPLINSTLTGVVLDSKNREPLIQAVLHIRGTTHSVETDANGKFSFVTGQKFPYTLEVSYIGYNKQDVEVTESPVEILLSE